MPQETPNRTRRRLLQAAGASITAIVAGCGSAPRTGTMEAGTATGTQTTSAPPETPQGRVEQLDAYPRVQVGSVSELSTGDVSRFNYPLQGQQNFLTKLGTEAWGGVGESDDIVAFNSLCTHAGCGITGQVSPEDNMAGPCPCHFTSFDLTKSGLVVLGQATTDLPQVRLEVEEGDIYATGMDGLVWGYHDNLRNGQPVEAGQQSGGETTGSTPTPSGSGESGFGGWFDDVSNFDGVTDRTGQSQVTVTVGAQGNNGAFAYDPPAIRIDAGTTVQFEWTGNGGQHNVVDENDAFSSDLYGEAGIHFEHTFEEVGTFKYYCTPHRSLGMKGAVVVE